ncbi:Hypothetical protein AA314_00581 [Archangium gephyra]|uniref:Uncharacterized protein n=1 Tax=Archangium gephyra TaxID=48 RepID=A0AAC8Q0Y1_9BACT|nr:Hypothetical protein AA314_00581 [Archangium gephyra]
MYTGRGERAGAEENIFDRFARDERIEWVLAIRVGTHGAGAQMGQGCFRDLDHGVLGGKFEAIGDGRV